MPTTLKVQLAVALNTDFLRKVSFFANLDGTISAALVLSMRPRVCLPSELIIMQGDVTRALYFIRSGACEVLKLEGPMGLPTSDSFDLGASAVDHELGPVVAVLRDHACFGEQSFVRQTPALATVRAQGYTTLMRIFKRDFDVIVRMFPRLRVHMLGVQRDQLQEYKLSESQGKTLRRSGRMASVANLSLRIRELRSRASSSQAFDWGRTGERSSCRLSRHSGAALNKVAPHAGATTTETTSLS